MIRRQRPNCGKDWYSLVASFSGTNREFREWLAARTANVVSLAEYRRRRKAAWRAARVKPVKPIIA